MTMPIRFRLTAWYALVLAGALALFSGLIWFSLRDRLLKELDRELAGRADQFQAYTIQEASEYKANRLKGELEEFCQALPPGSILELRGPNGFEFHHVSNEPVPLDRRRQLHRQFSIGTQVFQLDVTASERPVHRTLELLQVLLFSLVPVVICVASLGGMWLSRRALRPVDDLTRAAQLTAIDNLSQRLPVPKTGDELQRLTEVWNSMLERLEKAVTTLSQFAADASHELRTPLAVIRTSAELALRRARSPEAYRESLTELAAEAERMTQLVEDLMLLARTDAQASGMPKEPVEVQTVLAETVEQLRPLAEIRSIGIRREWDAAQVTIVSANRAALRRVFLVLLDNAVKYSHPGASVLVSLYPSGESVIASFQDWGRGISDVDKPHIFQRFYQADPSRQDGGFGLGLSLAQSIARVHGAEIAFESQERIGSTFSIRLRASTATGRTETQHLHAGPLHG